MVDNRETNKEAHIQVINAGITYFLHFWKKKRKVQRTVKNGKFGKLVDIRVMTNQKINGGHRECFFWKQFDNSNGSPEICMLSC